MSSEEKNEGVTELRVRECPDPLHDRIEKYISRVHDNENRRLNKQTATLELLVIALDLKGIFIPQTV